MSYAVVMQGITKHYGGLVANEGIDLSVEAGEVHALVGENGAGKSTLMLILCGLVRPDAGRIELHGRPQGPAGGVLRPGVGLVAQHFSLVPTLTAWENVVLGQEPVRAGLLDRARARAQTAALADRLDVELPLDVPVETLPVGSRQIVEILKALYRKATVLVLDEPTSTLSPPEADRLFALLRRLRKSGTTVLFVTHRIREVCDHADRATVLRQGRLVRTFARDEIEAEALVRAIVGPRAGASTGPADLRTPAGSASQVSGPLLEIRDLAVSVRVRDLNFTLDRGEILGIAGVAGNGQEEFVGALTGRLSVRAGHLRLCGRDVTRDSTAARRAQGLAYIPEDRHAEGLIPSFSIRDNLVLGAHRRYAGLRGLDLPAISARARDLVARFDIRIPGLLRPAASLSGGNQQKVVVARELARNPDLVVAVHPTRGLDLTAAAFVQAQLCNVRARGGGVLLFSADLEELQTFSDRIVVFYRGRIAGEQCRGAFDTEALGRMMTGAVRPPGGSPPETRPGTGGG